MADSSAKAALPPIRTPSPQRLPWWLIPRVKIVRPPCKRARYFSSKPHWVGEELPWASDPPSPPPLDGDDPVAVAQNIASRPAWLIREWLRRERQLLPAVEEEVEEELEEHRCVIVVLYCNYMCVLVERESVRERGGVFERERERKGGSVC
jgi:hypothetical protein